MPDDAEEIEEMNEGPDFEATYPDGSVQNECWAEKGYTRKRTSNAGNDDDLRILRGD